MWIQKWSIWEQDTSTAHIPFKRNYEMSCIRGFSCHALEVTWEHQSEKLPKSKLYLEKKTWDQMTFQFNIYCHLTCLEMLKNWPIYINRCFCRRQRTEKAQINNNFRHSHILILYFTVLPEGKKREGGHLKCNFQNYCLAAERDLTDNKTSSSSTVWGKTCVELIGLHNREDCKR